MAATSAGVYCPSLAKQARGAASCGDAFSQHSMVRCAGRAGLVRAPLAVICRRIELDQAATLPVANAVSAGANAADRYLGNVHNSAPADEPRQRTATLGIAGGDCGFSIALVRGLLEPVDSASHHPTLLAESADGWSLTGSKRALADGLLSSTELPRDALWPTRILCLALHNGNWMACLVPTQRQGVVLYAGGQMPGAVGSMWYSTTLR